MLKELSEPAGAVIYCSRFKVMNTATNTSTHKHILSHFNFLPFPFAPAVQKGDPTLSVLELWGAEYQESNALLLHPTDRPFLEKVCRREKCPVDFVGNITGDGKVSFSPDQVDQMHVHCADTADQHDQEYPQFVCFCGFSHRLCWWMMRGVRAVRQMGVAVLLICSWSGFWERCLRRSSRWSV